jgi:hypothetical protein
MRYERLWTYSVSLVWLIGAFSVLSRADAPADRTAPGGHRCPLFVSAAPWCTSVSDTPTLTPSVGPFLTAPSGNEAVRKADANGSTTRGTLFGVTWSGSVLLSFDPNAGTVLQRHLQLNPREAFTALAYDSIRRRLFALPQDTKNLYIIDTDSLTMTHVGSLQVDPYPNELTDTVSLAYNPVTNTLYTVVGRWRSYPDGPVSGDLATVNQSTGELSILGTIGEGWVVSLAFMPTDGHLYGLVVDGAGSWDSPYPTRVVRIDPQTATSETLFATPYHTMMGMAFQDPSTFFSWINWTSHFYGLTEMTAHAISQLGDADPVGVISAMTWGELRLGTSPILVPPQPVSFEYDGVVSSVWDPEDRLHGRVRPGNRFAGHFSYDAAAPYEINDPNGSAQYGLSLHLKNVRYSSKGLSAAIGNNVYRSSDRTVLDWFSLQAYAEEGATINWHLTDSSAGALSGNSRLPVRFGLSAWDENTFTIRGGSPYSDPSYYISGRVEHVTRTKRANGE